MLFIYLYSWLLGSMRPAPLPAPLPLDDAEVSPLEVDTGSDTGIE